MASDPDTPSKGSKSGVWDNNGFLSELNIALYQACDATHGLTPALKDAVSEYLGQQGYNVTFNAIR
jgi:hypothetical protein